MAGAGVHLPIVFITGYGDVEMSVKAMKAGAVDFLRKPFRDQDILDAVSDALRRDEARLASDEAMFALRTSYGTLTSREREVMSYVVDGMLNKQVAAILKLSEITVKTHRAQVMRKLACRSLADLVRKAETLGIGSHSCIPSLRQTATPS
ncbi:Response regulator receiver domain-containing protein [Paraburkholderia caballeronis]|uniref:Response regulator receiver domain-containing protein n=2 Tax=Paraburkholderia caballeronis TaxID=416943 RepID=A0A1H7L8S4_9BURK|nr:response regulator receiver domain-containing protein [Paraburkholderia caballeronis]PXX03692.1 response regulator receiver domain-containing protein [Paraburkholderia caballeronis]RAK04436.1 response regulator receiver domain-containing protein [Paraburkholderia caballeronis]SEK94875.1 Response regulator receiver domain-containing protein [Paraburkholderia caballeronis]